MNKNSIDANFGEFVEQAAGILQFIVVDDGVNGDVDLSRVLMGIAAKFGNIGHAVTSRSTCAKARCTNIYSVGTMIDGGLATLQILGRSQQFKFCHPLFLI